MQRGTSNLENCDSILDVVVTATPKALHLNLSIYEKGPDGNIQVIEQIIDMRSREVHLRLRWDLRIQVTTP